MSWVSPTGFEDPDSFWSDEPYVYDESIYTHSYTRSVIYPDGYCSPLVLTLDSSIQCDAIQVYVGTKYANFIFKIEVYDGSEWTTVYEGTLLGSPNWNEISFSQQTVIKARFSAKYTGDDLFDTARCYEFDFWEVAEEGLKKVLRLSFPLCVTLEAMNVAKGDKVLKVNEGVGVVLVAKDAEKGDIVLVL